MHSSFRELYLSRIREFFREPARIFWVYGFPTILAVCLGLAFKGQTRDTVAVDVVENADAPRVLEALREYEARALRTDPPAPLLKVRSGSESEVFDRLRTAKTALAVIPGPSDEVTYRFDGSRAESRLARLVVDDVLQRAWGRGDSLEAREALVQERGARYIDWLIPGLIGMNAMGGGLWGIGFLVVGFRRNKLLKRFVATPMPRRNFLGAILAARLTFLIPDVVVLLSIGVFVFGMPIRGSLALVFLIELAGAAAFAGIGLLIASRVNTTETVNGLINMVMLPMWMFSGIFFSYERYPEALHPFIKALPMTQLLDALRGVILEGAGPADVAAPLAILACWGLATFTLALRLFKWT